MSLIRLIRLIRLSPSLFLLFFLAGFFSFCPLPVHALDSVHLITSGKDARPEQGDDDFVQVIYFSIPEAVMDSLYLRLFDPDCGGALDERFGDWNTQTRFAFYGKGALSDSKHQEKPLLEKIFAVDTFTDSKWFTIAKINPASGELNDRYHFFKLVIQGLSGDDGNVYDVTLSQDDKFNQPPPELKMYNHDPAFNLPRTGRRFAELRFFIPKASQAVHIKNFDLENVQAWFESYYAEDVPLTPSGQGNWAETTVSLLPDATGQWGAVIIRSNSEHHNNAVVRITDDTDRVLPVELPIFLHHPNNRPQVVVDMEYLSNCLSVVFDASRSHDPDGHFLEYHWNFGDGKTAKGARVTHQYASFGDYDGELVVIDDSGRIGNRTRQFFHVKINEPPRASAGPERTATPGEMISFDASESHDPDGRIVQYAWDFDDGERVTGKTVSHTFRHPGLYQVRLRVEDDSQSLCNNGQDKADVWINAPPVVDVGPDRIAAPNEIVSFDGSNCFDSDGDIIGFAWDFGDGATETGKTVSHAFTAPGRYTVTLTVSDNANVKNSTAADQLIMVINDQPRAKAAVNKTAAAVDEALSFSASSSLDADGRLIDYAWDFGDGKAGRGEEILHAYEKPGVYTVSLQVKDNSGTKNDLDSDSVTVVINDPPVAEAGPDQRVTNSLVQFDGSASKDPDGELIAYDWEFGDDTTGKGADITHFYRRAGTYAVRLTVTDNSGTSTKKHADTLTVIVNEKPLADAGRDQMAEPGETLTFDGRGSLDPDGSIAAWRWDFGDGAMGVGPAVNHSFEKPGVYAVTLTVSDDTGHPEAIAFDEATVTINARPVADAGSGIRAAPGEVIAFDASGSYDPDGKITAYEWLFSDQEQPANTARVRRSFDAPGIYQAVLTVTDNSRAVNAQARDTVRIHINHPPQAKAGESVHTCDQTVAFDASASADPDGDVLTCSWDFGDKSPAAHGVKVTHAYEKGGTYPVILTVNDGTGLANASDQDSITVSINQTPAAKAGANRTECAGEIVLFNAAASIDPEGGALRYLWDFGDGTAAEGVNPTKIYKTGGMYPVTLTVEDSSGLSCDTDTDRILVQVAEAPVADAGGDQTVCASTLVRFDGSGSRDFDGLVNAYAWDFGDGHTAGGKNPTHVYEFPGVYRVQLTITGDQIGDCSNTNTDEMIVKVYEAPFAAFAAPPSAPLGESVLFDASQSAASKHRFIRDETADQSSDNGAVRIVSKAWDFGDGTTAEGETASHVYEKAGPYFVTLTVKTDSENDCNTSTVRKSLMINGPPAANAGADREAAIFESIVFDASASKDPDGGITSYSWDFGDGATAEGMTVAHAYVKSGMYPAVLTVTDNTGLSNNQDTHTINVRVNAPPKPQIALEKDRFCAGEEIRFNGQPSTDPDGDIIAWQWDFGDGARGEGRQISHTYAKPGRYPVVLTVDDGSPVKNHLAEIYHIVVVNDPPIAQAGSDRMVCPGVEVVFDASASKDSDGSLKAYAWDFGDGNQAEGKRVNHIFETPGTYEVRLAVTDDALCDCSAGEDTIRVRVNAPPVADAGPDRTIFTYGAHDAVLFDAKNSSDPDNDPLTCFWDFGDRSKGTGRKVFHYFSKPGTYTVRLKVDDGAGKNGAADCASGAATAEITVKGRQAP